MVQLVIYGDFEACGFSRAAKAAAEEWKTATPYCRASVKLVDVPIGELRAYKGGTPATPKVQALLSAIRKAKPAHDSLRTTLPGVFLEGRFVEEGFSGLDEALKGVVCALPAAKDLMKRGGRKVRGKTRSRSKKRRSRSRPKPPRRKSRPSRPKSRRKGNRARSKK
jgi:hypothetical protein